MKYIFMLVLVFALFSCGKTEKKPVTKEVVNTLDELQSKANAIFGTLPKQADNPENPITEAKVSLGKKLFFDTILSKDGNISCNSCHNLDTWGVDNEPTSLGDGGQRGGRNSPTVLNAALDFTQFWDGREPDVEAQAGGPILNPIEMAMPSKEAVIERLSAHHEYPALFELAFGKESVSYDNLQRAIGVFERTLITPSRFDEYLRGDKNAMSDDEKNGLKLFIDSGCVACHSGPNLGGKMFQKFGLVAGNYWEHTGSKEVDEGRFVVTGNEADKYVFKVPGLRNIEKTAPYFHDGSVNDLSVAVDIMAKLQLGRQLKEEEISLIVTFLSSLTGETPSNK